MDQTDAPEFIRVGKNFEEDITFAKRTEEAIKRYGKRLYKEMNARDFTNEIEKW